MSLAVSSVPLPAAAESLSVSGQQVQVTAIVAPAIYIIVDNQNQVLQIISNTTNKATVPTIYKTAVQVQNVQPLTPDVQRQVTAILRASKVQPGVVYTKRSEVATLSMRQILPLLTVRP